MVHADQTVGVVNRDAVRRSADRVRRNRAVRITEVHTYINADHFTVNINLGPRSIDTGGSFTSLTVNVHRRDVRHRTVIILNRVLEAVRTVVVRIRVYVIVHRHHHNHLPLPTRVIVTVPAINHHYPAPYQRIVRQYGVTVSSAVVALSSHRSHRRSSPSR